MAPLKTEASVATSVMPTCTVIRKRFGLRASSRATRAAGPLPRARCSSRLRREVSTAISAAAKKPFSRMRTRMINSSTENRKGHGG